MAKLVIAKTNTEFDAHRALVCSWFEGTAQELSPAHDFWSIFELLPLVKTKRLVRFVTATNVVWRHSKLSLDNLLLHRMPFFENQPKFGEGPWPIPKLKQVFAENPRIYTQACKQNADNRSRYGFNRDNDPITLVINEDGKQHLLDGNGRVYAALMADRTSINAWTGHMKGTHPKNYWVSTGPLKNLCYTIIHEAENRPELSAAALTMLRAELADNEVARINFRIWIQPYFPGLNSKLADVL
jgi:hypothetical protein